jgi:uncharacterized protein YodC (DUF2158 family)
MGFRLLELGEHVREGDLYLSTSGQWLATPIGGVRHTQAALSFARRRDGALTDEVIHNREVPSMNDEIKVGEVVVLNSGGPDMCVTAIVEARATCCWMHGDLRSLAIFPVACLILAIDPAKAVS